MYRFSGLDHVVDVRVYSIRHSLDMLRLFFRVKSNNESVYIHGVRESITKKQREKVKRERRHWLFDVVKSLRGGGGGGELAGDYGGTGEGKANPFKQLKLVFLFTLRHFHQTVA